MNMSSELEQACNYLINNAQPKPTGMCAKFVRQAIDAGFNDEIKAGKRKPVEHALEAKIYGSSLEKFGFKKIFCFPEDGTLTDYKEEIGDVAIIKYEPHGHMCMFTKKGWISDFIQRDMYGGKIRESNPDFDIYRIC